MSSGTRTRDIRERRWLARGDRGFATVEIAIALPALVVLVAGLMAVVSAIGLHTRCVDAAREGARAAARGESSTTASAAATSIAPDGSRVDIAIGAERATVTVRTTYAPIGGRFGSWEISAAATAALEPEASDIGGLAAMPGAVGLLALRRRWRRSGDPERGSGTVLVAAFGMALIIGALALLAVGQARSARHRAESAADFAALAGARVLIDGSGDPCAVATQVASENRATLADCVVDGETLVVATSIEMTFGRFGIGTAHGYARAGPADLVEAG